MRFIVVWHLLLSVLVNVTSIAVDGNSNCTEAIQSLETTLVATLEKKFEQLKAEIKENCCQGNTTGNSFLVIYFLIKFFLSSFQCKNVVVVFLGQMSHIPLARKFTRITSE